MKSYEIVFVAKQDLSSSDAHKMSDSLTRIIAKGGGSVDKKEYWGLRTLSYPINKNKKGHFFLFYTKCDNSTLDELRRNFRNNEAIIRHAEFSVKSFGEGPSLMMQMPVDNV